MLCALPSVDELKLWTCFDKIITTLQEKFNKIYSARTKLEAEVSILYGELNNAVDKQVRKVKIERLFVKSKDSFTRVVDKTEELFDLKQKLKIQMLVVGTLKND